MGLGVTHTPLPPCLSLSRSWGACIFPSPSSCPHPWLGPPRLVSPQFWSTQIVSAVQRPLRKSNSPKAEHHAPVGPVLGPPAAVKRLAQGPAALQWQAWYIPQVLWTVPQSGFPPWGHMLDGPDEEIACRVRPGVSAQPAAPALVGRGDRGSWNWFQGRQEALCVLLLLTSQQTCTRLPTAAVVANIVLLKRARQVPKMSVAAIPLYPKLSGRAQLSTNKHAVVGVPQVGSCRSDQISRFEDQKAELPWL